MISAAMFVFVCVLPYYAELKCRANHVLFTLFVGAACARGGRKLAVSAIENARDAVFNGRAHG